METCVEILKNALHENESELKSLQLTFNSHRLTFSEHQPAAVDDVADSMTSLGLAMVFRRMLQSAKADVLSEAVPGMFDAVDGLIRAYPPNLYAHPDFVVRNLSFVGLVSI